MWSNAKILAVDTVIDTLYFALNVYFIEGKDLVSKSVPFWTSIVGAGSISWPVFCVILRIQNINEVIIFKERVNFQRGKTKTPEKVKTEVKKKNFLWKFGKK